MTPREPCEPCLVGPLPAAPRVVAKAQAAGPAGMEAALQPRLQLDFDISFVAPEKRRAGGRHPRQILQDAAGRLRPGRLTAILGPSGAGKTSCLKILAGLRTAGVSGRVLVNGREVHADALRPHCVLIAQDLALLGALTARETLRVAADLKMATDRHHRQATVVAIAGILGLEACLDTAVANLSGGERKRLSIGVELVTNPAVMLFDEPTSGLDSVSSVQVVTHLRSLALAGRTVAVVLHQPSSRLYGLFDDLLVLGAGRVLYCGAADRAAAAFSAAGFVCPTFYNIADYVVEVASGEHGEGSAMLGVALGPGRPGRQEDAAAESDPMLGAKGAETEDDVVLEVERAWPGARGSATYPVSFCTQFAVLFRRSLLVSWRDMNVAWLRFAAHLLVATMLGVMYKDMGDEASKVTANVACLFFFVLFLFFSNAMPTVLTFPLEAAVFLREHANNWYSLPAYYLSKVLADLPFMVVNPTVFVLVAYHMTGQPTDDHRRCLVLLVCLLTVLLAHAFGLVFGAAFGMQLGIFLVPASAVPLVLFSGFFLSVPDIPFILRWLADVSNFRYGFEGIVISVYGRNRKPLHCSDAYCHWKRPSAFLEDVGMLHSDYWKDVAGLAVWIFTLHVLLVITLTVKVVLNRR